MNCICTVCKPEFVYFIANKATIGSAFQLYYNKIKNHDLLLVTHSVNIMH